MRAFASSIAANRQDSQSRNPFVSDLNDLRIALFQHKAWAETLEARFNWLDMVAQRAAKDGCALLLTPALFLDGDDSTPVPARSWLEERLAEIAALHELALVVGYAEINGDKTHDAALALSATGELLANARRLHLPAGRDDDRFAPGEELALFDIHGWRAALLVGRDLEFPEAARAAALAGAELLLCPEHPTGAQSATAELIAPARALENGVWLALANYSGENGAGGFAGLSRVIAPDGTQEAAAGTGQEIVTAALNKGRIGISRGTANYLRHRRVFDG